MRILVLNGSPKKKSDTFRLTEAFLKGLNKEHRPVSGMLRLLAETGRSLRDPG